MISSLTIKYDAEGIKFTANEITSSTRYTIKRPTYWVNVITCVCNNQIFVVRNGIVYTNSKYKWSGPDTLLELARVFVGPKSLTLYIPHSNVSYHDDATDHRFIPKMKIVLYSSVTKTIEEIAYPLLTNNSSTL